MVILFSRGKSGEAGFINGSFVMWVGFNQRRWR
jgi:hypothetical protein